MTEKVQAGRKYHHVVMSPEHADRLFPQPGRDALREGCREMLESTGGPILLTLTKGKFTAQPLVNGCELMLREDGDKAACDHPWHSNPGLITPCPQCGEGDDA